MTGHVLLDRMAHENQRRKIAIFVMLAVLTGTALTVQPC